MLKHMQFSLQGSFEKHGKWWLPDEPDSEVAGTLSYEADAYIRLDLVGSFGEEYPINEPYNVNIIQGITVDGIECTLCENELVSEPISFPGFHSQGFRSKYLFLGYYFNKLDDLNFASYAVNYEYLEEWLDRIPYVFDVDIGENKFEYHIDWPSRIYLKAQLPDINGEITLSDTLYTTEKSSKTVRMEHDVFLKYEPVKPQGFEEFRDLFFNLQHLLTLLLGESTYPRKIQAYIERERDDDKRRWPIGIIYNLPDAYPARRLYQHEMLVPFSVISDKIPDYISQWLANSGKLRPVYNLFFSYLYKPDMYLENRFLNLVHALESYHRIMIGGQYETDEEYTTHYDVIISAIPDDVPEELQQTLKSRLEYGNEFSLAMRLRELFDCIDAELAAFVTERVNPFIRKIVVTRNYFTHYNESLKSQALTGVEIFYACQRLRIFLSILLLQSIGIEEDTIMEHVSKNRRIQPWDNNMGE